jgi:hypothetical protein
MQDRCRMGCECTFTHHVKHMGGGWMLFGGGRFLMELSPLPPPHVMTHHGHHRGQMGSARPSS